MGGRRKQEAGHDAASNISTMSAERRRLHMSDTADVKEVHAHVELNRPSPNDSICLLVC